MMLETDKDTVKKMKFWGKIFVKYVFDKDRLNLKKMDIKITQHIKCNIKLRRRNDALNSSTVSGMQNCLCQDFWAICHEVKCIFALQSDKRSH